MRSISVCVECCEENQQSVRSISVCVECCEKNQQSVRSISVCVECCEELVLLTGRLGVKDSATAATLRKTLALH